MSKEPKQRPPTALSQTLKIYRDTHKWSQEELAALLEIEPRTLRRWENSETILSDMHELKRIADRLGIAYELLGIAHSLYTPLPLETIQTTTDRVWKLIDDAHIREAHAISEHLLQQAIHSVEVKDAARVAAFVRLYHAVGHAASLSAKTDEVGPAIYYFQQMEYFARLANNQTALNLALAYQGDMFRRRGDFARAIAVLEKARATTPLADESARGNVEQFLARAYIRVGRIQDSDSALKRSEEFAYQMKERGDSTENRYNLPMVYEEYAKSYDFIGKRREALDYIDRAEKMQPLSKSAEILFKVARAEVLIHDGDIQAGQPLAIEAAQYSREHGHYRRLERIYALKRFLNQQMFKISRAELALNEALEGPLEQ